MYRTIEKCEEYLEKGIPKNIVCKIANYLCKKYKLDWIEYMCLIDEGYEKQSDEDFYDGGNEIDNWRRLEINGKWSKENKFIFESYVDNLIWHGNQVGYWNGKEEKINAEELQELIINAYGGNKYGYLRRKTNDKWSNQRFANEIWWDIKEKNCLVA